MDAKETMNATEEPVVPHPCNICSKVFSSKDYLRVHHYTVHRNDNEICEICSKSFGNVAKLKAHIESVHNKSKDKEVMCEICSKVLRDKSALRQHKSIVHVDTRFKCPKCDNAYKTRYGVKLHILSAHSEERNYVCQDCGMTFKNNTVLLCHKRRIHPTENEIERRTCKECGHQVSKVSYLASHMVEHRRESAGLSNSFTNEEKIEAIKLANDIGFINAGEKLNIPWINIRQWARVAKKNTNEGEKRKKNHICSECGQSFYSNSALQNHMLSTHSNPNLGDQYTSFRGVRRDGFPKEFQREVAEFAKSHSVKEACLKYKMNDSTVRTFVKRIFHPIHCELCPQYVCANPCDIIRHMKNVHKIYDYTGHTKKANPNKKSDLGKFLEKEDVPDLNKPKEDNFNVKVYDPEAPPEPKVLKPPPKRKPPKKKTSKSKTKKVPKIKEESEESEHYEMENGVFEGHEENACNDDENSNDVPENVKLESKIDLHVEHVELTVQKQVSKVIPPPSVQVLTSREEESVDDPDELGDGDFKNGDTNVKEEIMDIETQDDEEIDNEVKDLKDEEVCSLINILGDMNNVKDESDEEDVENIGDYDEDIDNVKAEAESDQDNYNDTMDDDFDDANDKVNVKNEAEVKKVKIKKAIKKNLEIDLAEHGFNVNDEVLFVKPVHLDNQRLLHKLTKVLRMKRKVYQCDKCDYSSEMKPSFLAKHMLTHSDQRSHECEFCPSTFKTLSSRRKHERLLHPDQFSEEYLSKHRGTCSHCGKEFPDKARLAEHEKTHSDVKPFNCDQCTAGFRWKQSLIEHIGKVHEPEKQNRLICNECGASFLRKSRLTHHQQTVHYTGGPLQCDCGCENSFADPVKLRQHLNPKEKERVQCTECGKDFAGKRNLKVHFDIEHLGIKDQFECEYCNQRFSRITSLKAHVKLHTGNYKIWNCDHCSFSSKDKRYYKNHMLTCKRM